MRRLWPPPRPLLPTDYATLTLELTTDPSAQGYARMTTREQAWALSYRPRLPGAWATGLAARLGANRLSIVLGRDAARITPAEVAAALASEAGRGAWPVRGR